MTEQNGLSAEESILIYGPGSLWEKRIPELTHLVSTAFVNRSDRYGAYRAKGGAFTDKVLTDDSIKAHFAGERTIGLLSTSADRTCYWLAVDLDNHEEDPEQAAENFDEALSFQNRLQKIGIASLLEDSDGQGSFHLWILFRDPVPLAEIHALGLWLTGSEHEIYPKQKSLNGKGLGNWLRLPGKHHTRDHWSRFWVNGEWENGPEAMLFCPENDPETLERFRVEEEIPWPEPEVQKPKIIRAAEDQIEEMCWPELLESFGWESVDEDETRWIRPGADDRPSATLYENGRLQVFSSAADLPDGNYGKFRFWALHSGFTDRDQQKAAKTLLNAGDRRRPAATGDGLWPLKSAWDAIASPAPMREVVIEGLARRGEVVNIIASTKVGKSWLAVLLLLSVATGRKWLGREVIKGRVLLLDNELHDETIQNRLKLVSNALCTEFDEDPATFDYIDLRGQRVGLGDIEQQLARFQPGELTLIVLDAKYRFFGAGHSENSNDDQTEFHNSIDQLARKLDCVIVLVHHSTKGSQADKDVTDIGSGGGAQARATDCHMVIRPHEESDDLAVLDAAVRTFAPAEPQTIRWAFPLWAEENAITPELKRRATPGGDRAEKAKTDKMSTILSMLESAPEHIETENRLSGNNPSRVSFRSAITELEDSQKIEFVNNHTPKRCSNHVPAWRLILTEGGSDGGE